MAAPGVAADAAQPNPLGTQENLIGEQPWTHGTSWGNGHPNAHCGQDDDLPHRQISTTAEDPDGKFEAGGASTGYSDQQTFVLPDLADEDHVGSTDPRDWKTYFHAYPTSDGGAMVQYWHLFAYNALAVGAIGNHGGDWDASIQVQLGPDLKPQQIWFSRHSHDHPGDPMAPGQRRAAKARRHRRASSLTMAVSVTTLRRQVSHASISMRKRSHE